MSALVLTTELAQHIAQTPGMYAACVDAARRPQTTRVLFAVAEPETDVMRVVVDTDLSLPFLAGLAAGTRVAVVAVVLSSYSTYQFKGTVTEVLPAASDDAAGVATYLEAFGALAARVGIDPVRYAQTLRSGGLTTVRVAVDAVFDQTPRMGAGALVRSAHATTTSTQGA